MSSLFGALATSVSGLTAQSSAFSNISDNVANSQTTGYKQVDTNFEDYLTTSNSVSNDSGFVNTTPGYENNVQGNISASTNPLALAISGNGFFQVTQETSDATQVTALSSQTEYTRNGNFSLDKNGYLVNDAGQVLNGWNVNTATNQVAQNQVSPIQIDQSSFSPVQTSNVTLNANLPATPTTGTATTSSPLTSQVNVYDGLGTMHTVSLQWSQSMNNTTTPATAIPNSWDVSVVAPDATTPALGSATVTFGPTYDPNGKLLIPPGTIASITPDQASPITTPSTAQTAGNPASLIFTADFGSGSQAISLNLGDYGQSNGVTQFAGSTYTLQGLSQDGIAPGAFTGVTMQTSGDVVANYNNGQTRIVAQVPLTTFANPDALQRDNGEAFSPTVNSGVPLAVQASSGSAGALVVGSTEGSNVDIATEFTKLIVAQQAYGANAKLVTTASTLLQETIDMKQ